MGKSVFDYGEMLTSQRDAKSVSVYGNKADDDGKFFNAIASSIKRQMKSIKNVNFGPMQIMELIKLFVDKSAEVAKFCEEQKTKRAEIRANAQVAIHQIDSMRIFLQDYLNKSFDERRLLFAREFEIVDQCLATGNVQALAISLNAITDLAKSSPFKALADLKEVQSAIENHSTFDI